MEEKLIEGQFGPNKISLGIGIVGVTLLTLLCFFLLFSIGLLSIVCIGPFIVWYAVIIYLNCAAKNQKLIVTNARVYIVARKQEFSLPLDKISAVNIWGNNLNFTSSSGVIVSKGCKNARAVYDVVMRLLYERDTAGKVHENTSNQKAYIAEELNVYKKLVDENLITQEEYEAKKKKLLGL